MSSFHQRWARDILAASKDLEVVTVIDVVNEVFAPGSINRASMIVAFTQMLAQTISEAPPDIAAEIRSGLLSLIDGFAIRHAVENDDGAPR